MNKARAIVFGILTVLILCFIWGQSMLPRELSAGESTRLMQVVKPILDPNNRIEDDVFHHYLRKTAHFTEYAALGFCMTGFLSNLKRRRERLHFPLCLLACVLAAAVDECIQLFSMDRCPHVRDVALDSCGALFGIIVMMFLMFLIRKRRKAA